MRNRTGASLRYSLDAARQAGVERIIYLGGLGETGPDLSRAPLFAS